MDFDWTISVTGIVQIVAIVCGGFVFIWTLKTNILLLGARITQLEQETKDQNGKIDHQSEEIAKLGAIMITQGRMDERLLSMERDVQDMRRGRGFITDAFPKRGEE